MTTLTPEAHAALAAEFKASQAENERLRTRLIDLTEECDRLKKTLAKAYDWIESIALLSGPYTDLNGHAIVRDARIVLLDKPRASTTSPAK